MPNLSEPSKELAARLLSELGYEERLVGYKMTAMNGNTPESLYSLQEAIDILQADSPETLLLKGGNLSLGYIDPGDLRKWVEEVLGDSELAGAIGLELEMGKESGYAKQIGAIKALMAQRLRQCKELMEKETQQVPKG